MITHAAPVRGTPVLRRAPASPPAAALAVHPDVRGEGAGHAFGRMRVHAEAIAAPALPGVDGDAGRPVPAAERMDAERRWGRPLGHVRLHDDERAGMRALALGARAVTAGSHVFFAPGELRRGGAPLLAHELAHAAMQDPALGTWPGIVPDAHPAEQAARAAERGGNGVLPRAPVGVYRSPMPRADFERQMRRFTSGRIFTGTYEDQVARLNYFSAGTNLGDRLPRAGWLAWDPGADSLVYDWIISAFADFAARLGGIPPVQELVFFRIDYGADPSGTPVEKGDTLAAYGGGRMAVFSAVTRANARPAGRSAGAEAATTTPTQEEAVRENVAHELGHGLVETALTPRAGGAPAPDPAFMRDYRRAAGWTDGEPARLYDVGVQEVRDALAAGTPPPERYRITQARWNDPGWVEQPVSWYAPRHPSEDLPETVSFYVTRPALLRERSPRRFAFLDSRQAALRPFLRRGLSTIDLRLSPDALRRLVPPSTPLWTPVPPPAPPSTTPPVRLVPGPALEIRF